MKRRGQESGQGLGILFRCGAVRGVAHAVPPARAVAQRVTLRWDGAVRTVGNRDGQDGPEGNSPGRGGADNVPYVRSAPQQRAERVSAERHGKGAEPELA